jgi:hypothetical protein
MKRGGEAFREIVRRMGTKSVLTPFIVFFLIVGIVMVCLGYLNPTFIGVILLILAALVAAFIGLFIFFSVKNPNLLLSEEHTQRMTEMMSRMQDDRGPIPASTAQAVQPPYSGRLITQDATSGSGEP